MKGVSKLLVAACGLLAMAPHVLAGDHVRVVLDLSGSLKKNDPGRLVILSTVLLHDLAAPNPTLDDSFEILPFDQNWSWKNPEDPPPRSTRQRIVARFEQRSELVDALGNLGYDAAMTYFYPGIAAAIDDLRQTPGGSYDVRSIVLVTDGVPETPTRAKEAELIRRDLVPQLEKHGIRLYVLAFSAEALKHRAFLDDMVRGDGGQALGEVFLDPDGSQLLSHMLTLFARSFGFTPDVARELPGVRTLDLEGANEPERVAVVVQSPRPNPPSLRLTPPSNGALNAPDGVVSAGERDLSYSLIWSFSPNVGEYRFATNATRGSVAVLRPTRLDLDLRPPSPHVTMAQTPFPLTVLVKSPTGATGDPGQVDITFRPLGQRVRDVETGQEIYAWRGDRGAPPAGSDKKTDQGREYPILVEFEENRRDPRQVYAGYLEVEARRGEAVVGALRQYGARRVEVHPLLGLAPLPLTAYAAERALKRREQSCTRFSLTLATGELPHPDRPEYALRAVIKPPNKEVVHRELRDAFFTLDGLPLVVEGKDSPEAGAWYQGRSLGREDLLGEHEICIRLGKPTQGNPDLPLELPLAITLLESPYDDFRVVAPFTLKVLIAKPPILDRWRALFILAGALLALAALLWYLRDRPELPADLRYQLSRGEPAREAQALPAGPLLMRCLGLVVERPLRVGEDGETLGWLRPTDEQLYQVRPAPGLRLRGEGGQTVELQGGLAALDVRRSYVLEGERGQFGLRLEFALDSGPRTVNPRT